MQGKCLGSVIIPAHNEESVIERCLEALTSPAIKTSTPYRFEIAVVCNGCTDETAKVALKFPDVTVIEIPESSKVAALNVGDNSVAAFPRIYLDADSELSNHSARSLLRTAAEHPGPAILSATVQLDMSRCSILARSYARCARRTSFGELGIIGRGLYCLNAAGRKRFERFPDVLGDDLFAASLFDTGEQVIDTGATVIIRPAGDLRSLIRVRTRMYYGNLEAALAGVRSVSPERGWRNLAYAARRARSATDLLGVAVYAGVNLVAKRRAATMIRAGLSPRWERDESSRVPERSERSYV
jgi:glycosyltransferase involved in cell wall biosynthesis